MVLRSSKRKQNEPLSSPPTPPPQPSSQPTASPPPNMPLPYTPVSSPPTSTYQPRERTYREIKQRKRDDAKKREEEEQQRLQRQNLQLFELEPLQAESSLFTPNVIQKKSAEEQELKKLAKEYYDHTKNLLTFGKRMRDRGRNFFLKLKAINDQICKLSKKLNFSKLINQIYFISL